MGVIESWRENWLPWNYIDDHAYVNWQDLLEKTKPRLPPAPPHSRSLGEIREGRREGSGFARSREPERGGHGMSEEEMSMLLREVTCCLFGPFERFTSNVFFRLALILKLCLALLASYRSKSTICIFFLCMSCFFAALPHLSSAFTWSRSPPQRDQEQSEEEPSSPRLFNSVDISHFNISFNAGRLVARES